MSESGEIIWRPTPSFAEKTRIAVFMKRLGIASLAELQRRSVEDPEWYWRAVSDEFALRWTKPFRRVLDTSRGIAWPRWFEGGEFNFAVNCLDRHLDAGRGAKAALVWESDAGETRTLTYAELARETARVAHGLRRLGVGAGDRVGIFLPMCPEAVIATLAVARLGAIYTPCFSGYGAQAVASRLQDCEAKVLITADSFQRRGHIVRMKQTADEAADASPSVRHVVVVRRQGGDVPWIDGRDVWWEDVAAGGTADAAAEATEADTPLIIIYTSGTTGRPKGAVLTHGGFAIKTAHDFAFVMDLQRERPTVLADRPRLAHGADAHRRVSAARSHRDPLRGRARLSPAGSAVGPRRAPWGDGDGNLAHRGARPHAARGRVAAPARSRGAAHLRLHRRALESRAVPLAVRDGGAGAGADHELLRGHRDLRAASSRPSRTCR